MPDKKQKSIHFKMPQVWGIGARSSGTETRLHNIKIHEKMQTRNGLLFRAFFPHHSFIHYVFTVSLLFFIFPSSLASVAQIVIRFYVVQLTERAPVMRALCVRVAGRRRW